jgi:HPt (histidine-containing phosphotransfer) domain-containing protein
MNGFLSKPLDPQILLDSVQRLATGSSHGLAAPTPLDPAFLARLVAQLAHEHGPWLARVQTKEAAVPAGEMRAKLHKLTGSAGTLGLTQLHLAAQDAHALLDSSLPQALHQQLRVVAQALQQAVDQHPTPESHPHPDAPKTPATSPAPPLSRGEWDHLLQQIQRHNLAAVDVFQRLRPQLAAQVGDETLAALDRAMAALDFAVATEWLLSHPPEGVPVPQVPPAP